MYLGRLAELGTEDQVYQHPTHPYTQALLSAVPVPDPTLRGKREQIVLEGDVPSPANPPSGCRFHTRCWKAQDICSHETPQLIVRPDSVSGHESACHFAEVRQVVKTVDVSDQEPDARFVTTSVEDPSADRAVRDGEATQGNDPTRVEREDPSRSERDDRTL